MSSVKKVWWQVVGSIIGIRIIANKRKTIYLKYYDTDPCKSGACPLYNGHLCGKFRSPLNPKNDTFEDFCTNLDEIPIIDEFLEENELGYAYIGPDCIVTRTYRKKDSLKSLLMKRYNNHGYKKNT